jgi:starvation-inducible DNA-binding protein
VKKLKIELDLPVELREKVSVELEKLLADTYTLYLMSHNFHWNVKGPEFYHYHMLFEEHYTALALAVDEIAERIRALGFPAPATYHEFAKLTSLTEPEGVPPAKEMIKIAANAHKKLIEQARKTLKVAEECEDDTSIDVATQRLVFHEKVLWMLTTILE